ncbi:uncharacterized protein LAESUDRAFT_718609 [Laetiporus sulphureus 93-53]|uniref:Uncharacterized protein n=1 Tax=Laetiporus sulphureus 93-53 TaxID=1314785 RepID=A0A165AS47_9APHY|nr:uncharacterized protein LAESUDRAFT_718609 [Laetiporus sulphureus 93-53]KZS99555.1 hypothetical protein LAESUDRAFT_718609 [Laetiporus sulphureus 93-53]
MLTLEQATELKNAIAMQREKIVNWFRNEGNKGNRRARDAAKPVELYSWKYYDEEIKPLVTAEIERDGLEKQQTLAVIKRMTREAFENESVKVKDEIQAEIDAQHAVEDANAEEADSQPLPLQCQLLDEHSTLDNAPTILRGFLCELSCKTSWCFTVLRAGPAPQEGGALRTISANPKPSESLSSEREAELTSSTGLGESPSAERGMRHSSLSSSPHLNSESHLPDSLNFHSESNQTAADSTHPLNFDQNVTQNHAIRLGSLLPANASFKFDTELSASSTQLPSQLLTPAPAASFISAPPGLFVSSPSAAFTSAPSAGPTALMVASVPQPSSVGPPQHSPIALSLLHELFDGEPNADRDISACTTSAPSTSEVPQPQLKLPSTHSKTLQPLQVLPPVMSEIVQPLHPSLPITSEPEQPVDVTSPVIFETQPFLPASTPTTVAEQSTVKNVESDGTVEAEKGHRKGRVKDKENAVDAEVKKAFHK